jgi:hypothetical protein
MTPTQPSPSLHQLSPLLCQLHHHHASIVTLAVALTAPVIASAVTPAPTCCHCHVSCCHHRASIILSAVALTTPTLSSLSKWDVRGLFWDKRPHGAQYQGQGKHMKCPQPHHIILFRNGRGSFKAPSSPRYLLLTSWLSKVL